MDVTVKEDTKNRLVLEMKGENHAVLNALTKELWSDSHVKNVGYTTEHPLIGNHQLVVETDGADTRKTIQNAAKKLAKTIEKMRADASKALK